MVMLSENESKEKRDIPWLKSKINECRKFGDDKVADMLQEELDRMLIEHER